MPEGKSEIPADILAAAKRVFSEAMSFNTDYESEEVIAKALLAERQRCTEAAEVIQTRSDDYNGAYDGIADVIEAIRTPPSSTEES